MIPDPSDAYFRDTLKLYGVDYQQYSLIWKSQDGKCAICHQVSSERLQVDHCHRTNRVRGLLCRTCNVFLGFLDKFEELMPRIQEYLKCPQE